MTLKGKISLERALERLAAFQYQHYKKIIIAVLILTLFLGYGLTYLRFQGDLSKEMPQDLPVYKLDDRLASIFKGEESMVIMVTLNDSTGAEGLPRDIRDPLVIESVVELHKRLEAEPLIEGVQSLAPLFHHDVPGEGVKRVLDSAPGSERYINRDSSIMLIYAFTKVGTDEQKVNEITDIIQKDTEAITMPPGVDYKVTGNAPLVVKVIELLKSDMVRTTLIAALIIFALLVVLERSFSKGFIVFLPLIFTVIWTFGTMGWLGIAISISTAVIGAIILGLGVEYGIFMVSRYYEERTRYEPAESLKITVSNIGASTFGSGATTAAAFLALTISLMPMIQHLGQTLALGISFCWIAATLINPCFILFEERLESRTVAGWLQKWRSR